MLGMIAVVVSLAGPARAQLLHLDPLPFFTPADSTSRLALVVDVQRFDDSKFDWRTNRLLLTAILPAGDDATFFLRLSHLNFDTGAVPLRSRWPWTLGGDTPVDWPGEKRLSGFGKLEIGVTGPVVLPGLGGSDYGLALGLPTSDDRLYPLSSRSIPFRVQVRKPVVLSHGLQAGFLVGYLLHIDSGGQELDPFSFPSGFQLGASLARYGGRGTGWSLTWDYRNDDGRRSQLVGVQKWLPWSKTGTIGLRLGREIQGSLDRAAEWYFGLSWRLDSPGHRQGLPARTAVGR